MISRLSVTFISPAGPAPEAAVTAAVRLLENLGCRVRVAPHVFSGDPSGYLSAPLEERMADLRNSWLDPECDVIWCVRGGYGSLAAAEKIDWERLRVRPEMPVVGYSDITALHMRMLREKVGRPIVGAMCSTLTEKEFHRTAALISGAETPAVPLRDETGNFPAGGRLAAANLTVLASVCGTASMPDLSDTVLLLEDVSEPLYKIDRCLTQLEACGVTDRIAALAAGEFHRCGDEGAVIGLMKRMAVRHGKPFASGAPFGHREAPLPIELGAPAEFSFI